MSAQFPALPAPALDPTTAGYWLAAGEGRLVIQRCRACEMHRHSPTEVCYACGSLDWDWHEQSGAGVVYSYTWTDSPVIPALVQYGAYNVTVVELVGTNGVVRVLSRVVDVERADLVVGLPVEVDFDPIDDAIALPVFRPAASRRTEQEAR